MDNRNPLNRKYDTCFICGDSGMVSVSTQSEIHPNRWIYALTRCTCNAGAAFKANFAPVDLAVKTWIANSDRHVEYITILKNNADEAQDDLMKRFKLQHFKREAQYFNAMINLAESLSLLKIGALPHIPLPAIPRAPGFKFTRRQLEV